MKKLYRSRKKRIIAGVCGGLAEYFGLDVRIVRIVFLVAFLLPFLTFFGSFVCYCVLWVLVPQNPVQNGSKKTDGKVIDVDVVEKK
jgi:phage shock protein C